MPTFNRGGTDNLQRTLRLALGLWIWIVDQHVDNDRLILASFSQIVSSYRVYITTLFDGNDRSGNDRITIFFLYLQRDLIISRLGAGKRWFFFPSLERTVIV